MRIVVTGASGYLGRRLLKYKYYNTNDELILLAYDKLNMDFFNDFNNVKILSTSDNDIENAFKDKVDLVIHLATLYGRNDENYEKVLSANLLFPLKVLNNAINKNVPVIFNADTAIDKLVSEYAISKKQFLQWGKYYSINSKIRFVNMKLQHFYGPFDNNTKFIANMLETFKRNEKVINTTLGEQKRMFIYIDDLVTAISHIIDSEVVKSEAAFIEYEVGINETIKIKDALTIMKELTHSSSIINFGALPYRKDEEMESFCNNNKLKELGWVPKVLDFKDGIEKILSEEKK